jgi:DNA-binding NtrC family response regulator
MQVRSWHRFVPESCKANNSQILNELSRCGIVLDENQTDLGLLFFAQQQLDELLAQVRERGLFSSRVLMVALTDIPPPTDICWQLMEAGAADVIWWRGAPTAQHIQAKLQRWEHIEGELRSAIVRSHMVGESPAWIATLRELIEIARFGSGPCLLQGESGTGKELAARLLQP